ncbi:hypothetical protein ORI99_08105, partial [Alishewanella sp. SMS9]|nr:hypothetical protein [Alishewanella sp. SMS9]
MTQPLNKEQVKAILAKNGIQDLDQLANLIASSSVDNPLDDNINPVASSWVIKVFKLSADAAIGELPDNLGGDILRGNAGG